MKIKFTRHSKSRMKLYNISQEIVNFVIRHPENIERIIERIEVIATLPNFDYPIKVVYKEYGDYLLIITVYPLKKEFKK